ncbi:MAG TPA: hypothetical protein VG755_03050 [Nannocystaceae bacterium]|nr:hypothetical protein [Nannocystaceae bacterium]
MTERRGSSTPAEVLLAVLGLLVLGEPSVVDDDAFALQWEAPSACPAADEGRDELARRLGGRLPERGRVSVRITAAAEGWDARIVVDAAAPRELHARDCDALARAAAVVVAVAIDPLPDAARIAAIVPTAPISSPARDEPPPRRHTEIVTPRDDAPSTRPRERALYHRLRASAGVAWSPVPQLAGAIQLGYTLRSARRGLAQLEVMLLYATPRRIDYDDGVGGRFQAFTATARGCAAPQLGRVTLSVCGGVELGPLIGGGLGAQTTKTRADLWIALQAASAVAIALHRRLALVVAAELPVSVRRPAFHLGARDDLFRSPFVGVRGLLGLAVVLGRKR